MRGLMHPMGVDLMRSAFFRFAGRNSPTAVELAEHKVHF